jgi:hypothetical protein
MKPKILPLKLIPLLSVVLLLAGCAGDQAGSGISSSVSQYRPENKRWIKQALYAQFNEWQTVPHQIGGDTRHVGIYLDDRQFLHVSTSEGVTISNLGDRYWSGKYWKAVRILS